MAAWIKEKPIREGALSETSAGFKILRRVEERERIRQEAWSEAQKKSVEQNGKDGDEVMRDEAVVDEGGKRKIVFDEALGREVPKTRRMVRYQLNPRANWGPMAKAK